MDFILAWSVRDSKSLQLSRTLLSCLADLSIGMIWTVSILSLISSSPILLSRFSVIVPSTPCMINISTTFLILWKDPNFSRLFAFLSFFSAGMVKALFFLYIAIRSGLQFSGKIQVFLKIFSVSFIFALWSNRAEKSTLGKVIFFLLIYTRSCVFPG